MGVISVWVSGFGHWLWSVGGRIINIDYLIMQYLTSCHCSYFLVPSSLLYDQFEFCKLNFILVCVLWGGAISQFVISNIYGIRKVLLHGFVSTHNHFGYTFRDHEDGIWLIAAALPVGTSGCRQS